MGGRYCAINSPRGSRWGQISRDRGSRDFCPHRGPSGELIAQYRPPMSFCFYPTLYLGNHLHFLKPDSSWKQQKNTRISKIDSASTQLNVSSWWRHNIYLWRHNGARHHARAKHYEYFLLENWNQTLRVYWFNNHFELVYIYTWWNNLRLNQAIFFKFWNISKISIFILSIGTSLFEVLPLCFRKCHILRNC